MKLNRFTSRPVLPTVTSIAIVILGILSLTLLPISQYPDIAPPTVNVSTTYQGANAQAILNSVAVPPEEQINDVENVMYMNSTVTSTDEARIGAYLKQGIDPDMAAANVQSRVAKAQGLLPAEVTKVGVVALKRQTSMLLVFSSHSSDDKYDNEFLENCAKINLMPEVQCVLGVGDAMVFGVGYSACIWLKPDIMAQYHLMSTDVSAALTGQNIEAAPGAFGEEGSQTFRYTLRYKGHLQSQEEFKNIVIRTTKGGQVFRLKGVASTELGCLTYGFTNRVNGHPAVIVIILQTADPNATAIINGIPALLDKSTSVFPPSIKVNVSQNANGFLFASIHEMAETLIEAFTLVFTVVYIFLQDLRSILILAIAIPIALIGTFFVLYLIGFNVNLPTLCVTVLTIAVVVDGAVVVVEGVHAKLDQNYKSAHLASIDAMDELGGVIVSITLVTMSVSIPVSFMSGTSGTFYRQFGLMMAIAIALSALNALTLSLALCAILLRPHDPNRKEKVTLVKRFRTSFNATYDTTLKKRRKRVLFLIQKPQLTVDAVVTGFALMIFLMNVTPTGLASNEDTSTIMAIADMPLDSFKERTEAVMQQVDSLIVSESTIDSRAMIVGYNFITGQRLSYDSSACRLRNWDERSIEERSDLVSGMLYLKAREVIEGAHVLLFAPSMTPDYSVSDGFGVNLQGETGGSLDKFYEVVQDFISKLQARSKIQSAQTSFNPNFPQYMIDIDAAACKEAGPPSNDTLTTLQGHYGGLYSLNFNRFGKMHRVMIQAELNSYINLESLKSIKIYNGNEVAPVAQFMNIKRIYGPDNIKRFNMFTAMTINGSPVDSYSSGQAIQVIQEVAKQTLPTGYGYEFSGITREEQSSNDGSTAMTFVLYFVFVHLLLSAQYGNYILLLTVLLSIPSGLIGSFIFAHLMGLANNIIPVLGAVINNVYTQITLIMLVSLLTENTILIVELALDRCKTSMSTIWAVVLGAGARLRSILVTSLAMVVGLIPLMLAMGVGASGNRTLGTAAVGGVFTGMTYQTFVVPALFALLQYLQEKVKSIGWEDIDNTDAEAEIEQYAKQE